LWLWFFNVLYGTYDPRAPYGPAPQLLSWIVPAIMGLFFDGQYGIAAYAPAVALAFAGWWRRTETFSRRLAVELALIMFVYLAAVTTVRMWWAGGPATPARFLMALLPMLAVPIAVAWTRMTTATRALAVALVAVGVCVTAMLLSVDRAALAWNYRNGEPEWLEWLSPVANLSRVWPGFFWQEPRFPFHVVLWCAIATLLWLVARRVLTDARTAVTVWGLVTLSVLAPVGWAFTSAAPLDPAPAQMRVIASEGAGQRVYLVSMGRVVRLRSLHNALRLRPSEVAAVDGPQPLVRFENVPAARYIARVTSTASSPVPIRLFVGRSDTPWREFAVPGPGTFTFPFVVPFAATRLVLDTETALRASLHAELNVEDALPVRTALTVASAGHYGASDVLFLDDRVFIDHAVGQVAASGFWIRGRAATRFVLIPASNGPVTPLTVHILVRNGGADNTVTIESGTFQRLLMLAPGQEQALDIPLTPAGSAEIRVASGSGFVPAELDRASTDRRLLGVWIEPR